MVSAERPETARNRRIERAETLLARVTDARQRDALRRWCDVMAGAGAVTRGDLRAAFFGRNLDHVALIEVLEDIADYRHLIEGREVIRRFGQSGRGRFGAMYAADHLARLRVFHEAVRLSRSPNLRHFSVMSQVGERLDFSQLALPATGEDGAVSHVAVVFGFPDTLRRVPTAPLSMHSAWHRLERGTERETVMGDRG